MRFHRKRHASSAPWPFEIVITQKRETHPSALLWLLMQMLRGEGAHGGHIQAVALGRARVLGEGPLALFSAWG